MHTRGISLWSEYDIFSANRVYSLIICKLDGCRVCFIIVQPVLVWCHMACSTGVCVPAKTEVGDGICRLVLVTSSCVCLSLALSFVVLFALLALLLLLSVRCAGQSSGCAIQHPLDACPLFLQNK